MTSRGNSFCANSVGLITNCVWRHSPSTSPTEVLVERRDCDGIRRSAGSGAVNVTSGVPSVAAMPAVIPFDVIRRCAISLCGSAADGAPRRTCRRYGRLSPHSWRASTGPSAIAAGSPNAGHRRTPCLPDLMTPFEGVWNEPGQGRDKDGAVGRLSVRFQPDSNHLERGGLKIQPPMPPALFRVRTAPRSCPGRCRLPGHCPRTHPGAPWRTGARQR